MRPTMRTRGFTLPSSIACTIRPEDTRLRELLDRRRGGRGERRAKPVVVGRTARSRRRSRPTSPAGTRSPFSPSCTTSGTPPTAVAITGVPTASASSERVREVLPRRREQRGVDGAEEARARRRASRLRGSGPARRARARARAARATRARDRRPATRSVDAGHPGERGERDRRAPSARSAGPPCPSVGPSNPERAPAASSRDGSAGSSGAGFGTTVDAPSGRGPSRARSSRRYALGTTILRARRSAACARRAQQPDAEPAAHALEVRRACRRTVPRGAPARRPRRRRA